MAAKFQTLEGRVEWFEKRDKKRKRAKSDEESDDESAGSSRRKKKRKTKVSSAEILELHQAGKLKSCTVDQLKGYIRRKRDRGYKFDGQDIKLTGKKADIIDRIKEMLSNPDKLLK